MTISEITAILTGQRMMTKDTGAASDRHKTRSLGSRITSTRRAGGEMGTMSMTGSPRNVNSYITIASRALAAADPVTDFNAIQNGVALSRVSASFGHSRCWLPNIGSD
jgi:hypothetical protein